MPLKPWEALLLLITAFTANYCRLLPITADYCQLLPITANYDRRGRRRWRRERRWAGVRARNGLKIGTRTPLGSSRRFRVPLGGPGRLWEDSGGASGGASRGFWEILGGQGALGGSWGLSEMLGGFRMLSTGAESPEELGSILCYLLLWAQARFPERLPLEMSS